ncbi:Protein arginine methyltransferase NDUFAF7, mitochondrial [Halotydeus destructor]|nr:Protein arginine methyltransferase NDUFAF7, mitochondrial [Halotydeus destructor]
MLRRCSSLVRSVQNQVSSLSSKSAGRVSIYKTLTRNSSAIQIKDGLQPKRTLHNEIIKRIKVSGPMTVSEYMRLVLTNPITGFYMTQDVFGSKGHFTTSPEISQVFGELVGVWLVNEWQRVGCPKPFRIIELGPGRGTLAADIGRVLSQFSQTRDSSSLHLVEISPHLTQIQEQTLCGTSSLSEGDRNKKLHSLCKSGIPVTWYQTLEDVPDKTGFNAFVAHEFFDALPIHKFQKNEQGQYREVLIDFDDKTEELRYVIARNETPATKVFIDKDEVSTHFEVSPQTALIVNQVADNLNRNNGCFLICDYGYDDAKKTNKIKDTFRGFKNHALWNALEGAGTADLTADVDFGYIKRQVQDKALFFGPVSQEHFLKSLGIELRLQKLLEMATQEEQVALKSGVNMVVNEMGQRFKFLSLFPRNNRDHFLNNPPAGF